MSVLERRFNCPASMRLEEGRAGYESEYSRRGTGLHAAAAEALEGGQEASGVLPDDDVDGQDIIAPWLALVRAAHELLGGELLVEHQFSLAALHDLYWGTADAVIVSPPALWVGDLKTGGGHPVPVRRPDGRPNFQLAGYALGVLQSLPQGTRIETVTLCVSQPRRGSLQSTDMSFAEVMDLAADMLEIAERATAPDAAAIPGDHCTFCKGAPVCPALRQQALAVAASEFDDECPLDERLPLPALPADLTTEQLGRILSHASLLRIWLAAVEAHALGEARRGTAIPGWKLAGKRSARRWADEDRASDALTFLLEENRFAPRELLSPAQAEKALKRVRLAKPPGWDKLITWTDPGTTLVPVDDPRPAIKATVVAALEFNNETEEQ
jgi:hypothetical protein